MKDSDKKPGPPSFAEARVFLAQAEKYLESLVYLPEKDRPLTEADMRDVIREAKDELRQEVLSQKAFLMAVVADQPLPLKYFHSWGSKPSFKQWEREGLKLERFNGKTMVRPRTFFTFVEAKLAEDRKDD